MRKSEKPSITSGSRSSHEERGLKSPLKDVFEALAMSLLSRGAWIEILPRKNKLLFRIVAPLTRSVD